MEMALYASQRDHVARVLDRVIAPHPSRMSETFADVDRPPSGLRRNMSLFLSSLACLLASALRLNVRLDSTSPPPVFSQAASEFRGS